MTKCDTQWTTFSLFVCIEESAVSQHIITSDLIMLISHREADKCIFFIAYKIVAGDGSVVNYSVIDGFRTDGRFRGLEIARDRSEKLNYLRSPMCTEEEGGEFGLY